MAISKTLDEQIAIKATPAALQHCGQVNRRCLTNERNFGSGASPKRHR